MKKYRVFDIGKHSHYFDDAKNKAIMHKVAHKCYLPTTKLLLKLVKAHQGRFRCAFSITDVALEQFETYAPEVLKVLQELNKTGCVEFLSETYHHSLSFLYSKQEFKEQVELHTKKMKELFNAEPKVFRNTELIFNNELAYHVQELGYKGILTEGADHILGWRSSNFLYSSVSAPQLKLLLKNYKLSDDIAFRFGEKSWKEWPLTVPKYVNWINQVNGGGEVINLFMDYETFGEHQWADKGIFEFLEHLPGEVLKHPHNSFLTPSEVVRRFDIRGTLDVHNPISWADVERDLSAWRGNSIQREALEKLYSMEQQVKGSGDQEIIEDWRRLTTSDHFYYMCTKWFNDGDVHKYFNPFDSPYDSFIAFMNALHDLQLRLKDRAADSDADNEASREASGEASREMDEKDAKIQAIEALPVEVVHHAKK